MQPAQEEWHSAGKGKTRRQREGNWFRAYLCCYCPRAQLDCFVPQDNGKAFPLQICLLVKGRKGRSAKRLHSTLLEDKGQPQIAAH